MTQWDSRANNFDFMRLALALLVIYSHAFPLGSGHMEQEPLIVFAHGQNSLGGLAVDCFFIISGFLITASVQRSTSIFSFLKKRVQRIYPGFIVAMLVDACIVLPIALGRFPEISRRERVWDFVTHTLRLVEFNSVDSFPHNLAPHIINGATWSVAFEFYCYLLVAVLALSRVLRIRWAVLGLFIVAWLTGIYFRYKAIVMWGGVVGAWIGPIHFWARLLPLYLAGVVFYLFRDRIRLSPWLAGLCVVLMYGTHWLWYTWAIIFPIAGTYLLFWFAFTPAINLHRAGRFGDFSYGTYLYGYPIEQLVMEFVGHPIPAWQLTLIAVPLTLIVAVASWYGVERHFLRPARRKETIAHAVLEPAREPAQVAH